MTLPMKNRMISLVQRIVIMGIGIGMFFIVGILFGEPSAHALPEFASQTGEPCSTCHVNPGGGGPRTLRGLMWAAQGRPDLVPDIGDILIAPGVNDGVELYDTSCAACHGAAGEGLFGSTLTSSGISESNILSSILRGRERSGMPSFEGRFTDTQLGVLVTYVTGIASGAIEPAPLSYPLEFAQFECENSPVNHKYATVILFACCIFLQISSWTFSNV